MRELEKITLEYIEARDRFDRFNRDSVDRLLHQHKKNCELAKYTHYKKCVEIVSKLKKEGDKI